MSRSGSNLSKPGQLLATLLGDARLNLPFVALTAASAAIASLGLLENSTAVIIGAMIIAPLLMPIQGISFGVLHGDGRLTYRAVATLAAGSALALLISYLLGLVFGYGALGSEATARTYPTLLDLGIAVCAGAIGGFAKIRRDLSASVAGTAIAVALMPPLCVVGLEMSRMHAQLAGGALLLFMTNVLGITVACMAAYLIGGYADFRHVRMRLLGAAAIVLLLLVPLGANLLRLIEQAQIEHAILASLTGTVTFSQVSLVNLKVNWLASPPEVTIVVRSGHAITPTQIALVEAFVKRKMRKDFRLIVDVGRFDEVTSSGAAGATDAADAAAAPSQP
ncbi:MAG: DUF389 domain-containing protein [Candidatus Eremiobacteraeota bacterium]|nr:DUF389 domain-containing protein [Candidatus Eremiobacteraeota bacterium]MBC5821028.1 DUF389 domain-containing protein [Candidatus Eremiobacteraeota bacterium]